MNRGAIDVIEAAYRTEGTSADWLRGIAQALPVHAKSLGFALYTYRIKNDGHLAVQDFVGVGTPIDMEPMTRAAMAAMPPAYVRETWATVPCATAISTGSPETREQTRSSMSHLFGHIGVRDIMVINGIDPTGEGVYAGNLVGEEATMSRRERATWSRVAAHLSACYRLRRLPGIEPDAVITPQGRIDDAIDDARTRSAQDSLRTAALAIERARSKRRRTNDREAVELWHALVAGRWTLIEQVDRDGRRFFVARKNDPAVARHHALTRRERQVVGYAALGHSNKLIAYEMGLSVSAVAVYLDVAMEKLGLPSRAALIVAARAFGAT
jgi:DNA-binding CsgD family transcriptional regulator